MKNKSKSDQTPVLKVESSPEQKPNSDEKENVKVTIDENAPQNSSHEANSNTTSFLRPSPSETSLTRSRSLNFPAKPKHSPDCKDNPYKF